MDIASHQTENNDINKEKNDLKVTVIFPAKNEEVQLKIQYQWHHEVVLPQDGLRDPPA